MEIILVTMSAIARPLYLDFKPRQPNIIPKILGRKNKKSSPKEQIPKTREAIAKPLPFVFGSC